MLTRILRKAVSADPDRTAIVQGSRRVSYRDLERAAGHCAGWLRQLGVQPGDCVAVALPNCPEFVILFFAVARLRAIMLPLNPDYTQEEARRLLAERPARVLVTDARREPVLRDCAGDARVLTVGQERWEVSAEVAPPDDEFSGDVLYLFTSGSTDSYKCLCFTQRNLYFEAHNFVTTAGTGAGDNILCTIPLHHSYGLGNCLLDAAYTGATLVLEAEPDSPFASRSRRVLGLLREEDIRVYPGVPWQFDVLAAGGEDLTPYFKNVRWCMSTGDVLPQRTYDRFLARAGQPIRSCYGSTEAGSVTLNTDAPEDVRYGSLGAPIENVTIEIRNGEIWVKSPGLPPSGYDNRPDLTREAFRGGFFNSGDLGRLDDRGHLFMVGRKQTFVTVAGRKVDTSEVEEVLAGCPGVRDAAVLGVEVPRIGTVLKAAVVTEGVCAKAQLRSYCRQRLAAYKVPRFIQAYAELPRSPTGKVLKRDLGGVEEFSAGVVGADVARLFAASPGRRRSLVASMVRELVGVVLGQPAEHVPAGAGFTELGMDSSGSLELLVRLETLFARELPSTFTFDYPTVNDVTDNLLELLHE